MNERGKTLTDETQATMYLELDTLDKLSNKHHIVAKKNQHFQYSNFPSDENIFKKVSNIIETQHLNNSQHKHEITEPGKEWDLATMGIISEQDLMDIYSKVSSFEAIQEEDLENINKFDNLTCDYLFNKHCIPVNWEDNHVLIAIMQPYQIPKLAYDWTAIFNVTTSFVLARRSVIERFISKIYDNNEQEEADNFLWDSDNSEEALQNLAKEAPIVRLVNDTFSRAIEMDASDIHIEPLESEFVIRYRIDGILSVVNQLSLAMFPAVASRVKLIAGMNIAEHRLPQDGRTDLQIGKVAIDVRISTVPSTHGESIVMRILRKNIGAYDFESIGMDIDIKKEFEKILSFSHGIILVVGPTGSGKSTTLYCAMNQLNNGKTKIITIEDPVEYQTEGITQVQVNTSIGLTFSKGLRSFLRQDPDVILVGEIRDKETAEIAINAALTGHLVLSTLHTNDASGAISRLLDMGIEGFLIASSLVAILSQRLVRKICTPCKGTGFLKSKIIDKPEKTLKCKKCSGRGLKGRLGIFEFLLVNEEIRTAINEHKDSSEIAEIAIRNGMIPLEKEGLKKVKNGLTTEAEVSRVCQFDLA